MKIQTAAWYGSPSKILKYRLRFQPLSFANLKLKDIETGPQILYKKMTEIVGPRKPMFFQKKNIMAYIFENCLAPTPPKLIEYWLTRCLWNRFNSVSKFQNDPPWRLKLKMSTKNCFSFGFPSCSTRLYLGRRFGRSRNSKDFPFKSEPIFCTRKYFTGLFKTLKVVHLIFSQGLGKIRFAHVCVQISPFRELWLWKLKQKLSKKNGSWSP
jgi:hypothetical protein